MQKTKEHHAIQGEFKNHFLKLKLLLGIWTGKTLITITRLLGRGGTTLPGRLALKIAPHIPSCLSGLLPEGCLIVTGTNGKTTTSALITGILKEAGYSCVHNQSGSNMSWGVVSALIAAASWRGHIFEDFAVLEVDEGAFPQVAQNVKPRGIIITNIFRDQLDRYGEVDQIRDNIIKGMDLQPEYGFEVLNADDPSLVSIEKRSGKKRLSYGLEFNPGADTFKNTGRDIKTCPLCSAKLDYKRIFYAHLGHYHCPDCGYKRQEPDVKLTECITNPDNTANLQIALPGEAIKTNFPLMGTYNLYNLLAAVTCAKALNISGTDITAALEKSIPSFGRMELFKLNSKTIVIALIKNPVGANEVLRTILNEADRISLLITINDKIADGTDVSWLWDVDFEQLSAARDKLTGITVSGLRAWDMAVRFKYSGFDPAQIRVEENAARAVERAIEDTPNGGKLFILPTYTAMLEIRRILNKKGLGKPYWEE